MNVLEAVQMLKERGGKIRRPTWQWNAYVTHNGRDESARFSYYQPWAADKPPMYRCAGQPTLADMLATDWIWES